MTSRCPTRYVEERRRAHTCVRREPFNSLASHIPFPVPIPTQVELLVVDCDPGLKGDTSGGGSKPAKVETGATVTVPLFVQIDDVIQVDTRTGDYLGRA